MQSPKMDLGDDELRYMSSSVKDDWMSDRRVQVGVLESASHSQYALFIQVGAG